MSRSQVPEAGPLLAAKLHPPRLRPDRLGRPRLIAQVEAALGRPLVLVSAQAGSGKSTLLADWATETHRRVAWVSLEPSDDDPVRFWSYVVAAIAVVRPGLPEGVSVPPSHEAAAAVVAIALVNELRRNPAELVVVLDDYHVIDSPEIHRGIGSLVEHLPAAVHMVIATRSDPSLPLTSLRARGLVAELRQSDLRFTPAEAAALLRDAWGLAVSDGGLATLAGRTEGWAAGYQLAGLSLQGRSDTDSFIARLSGTNRYIIDYLTEEVLQRESAEVRGFLLQTSILERLSGGLCDAVTGGTDGQHRLEALERANLFVVALDEERHWYRYHHLFADLLRARLVRELPDGVIDLHRRAAAWHRDRGLIDEAIRHALAARELGDAAEIVEAHADEVLARGEGETLRRWLAALPEEAVRSRPRLGVIMAVSALNAGRLEVVERLLIATEAGIGDRREVPRGPASRLGSATENLPAAIANLRATMALIRGEPDRASALAQEALQRIPAGEHGPKLSSQWNLAIAGWMHGRLEEAQAGFRAIVQLGQGEGSAHLVLTASAVLGRIHGARGRLDAALATYRQALDWTSSVGPPRAPAAGAVLIGIARVLYERDEPENALRNVTEGIELARHLNATMEAALGLVTLGWIRHATGDRAGALQAVAEAQALHPDRGSVSLYNPVHAEAATLLLRSGQVAEVAAWVAGRALQDDDAPSYPREREYVVLARLRLARGELEPALALLERIRAVADAQSRDAAVIEALVLEALAHHQLGDHEVAAARLAEALGRGQHQRYVRIFADEGPVIGSLVGRLIASGRRGEPPASNHLLAGYLRQVQRASAEAEGGKDPQPVLAGGLTDRERQVLRLIALGRRNREIAEELVVTLDTVKRHVAHTFEKLGVVNRTQAVAEARQLGLIE